MKLQIPSFWTIALHSILSLAALSAGVYVLLEKKMLIGGRLIASAVYEFPFPANLVMASSLILLSVFIMLTLYENKAIKKTAEWILIVALVLFFLGAFI